MGAWQNTCHTCRNHAELRPAFGGSHVHSCINSYRSRNLTWYSAVGCFCRSYCTCSRISRSFAVFTYFADPPPTDDRELPSKDFGLGVGVSELVVVRSGMDESTGGYQYTVIFLEETKDVPKMLVGVHAPWGLHSAKSLCALGAGHRACMPCYMSLSKRNNAQTLNSGTTNESEACARLSAYAFELVAVILFWSVRLSGHHPTKARGLAMMW